MKRLFLLLTLGAVLACPSYAQSTNSSTSTPPGGHHDHDRGGMLSDADRQELHTAHDAALKANPDLAAEGKDLQEKMEAYHKKLDAAMIAADPKVEPIITKMEASHPHHGGPDGGPNADGTLPAGN